MHYRGDMRTLLALLLCPFALVLAGCGTIKNLADTGGTVYGGVKRNLDDADNLRVDRPCIEQGWIMPNINTDPCVAPLYPIDLLLCIASDTILLPYTCTRSLIRKHRDAATRADQPGDRQSNNELNPTNQGAP